MYNFVLTVHVLVVLGLVGVILIQRGRSGGLVEALGGVESIFGTKTNNFFVKITVILAIGFFLTSISLAYLAKKKGESLMEKQVSASEVEATVKSIQGQVEEDIPRQVNTDVSGNNSETQASTSE